MNKLLKCLLPPLSGMSVGFLCLNEAYTHSGTTQYSKKDLINNRELAKRITKRHNTMKRFGVEINN
tara:strand:+ start:1339 stop:1536 length:198 start_codon:yes stop_codon:yes gene_type:complete